jgi:hypothetical protein
VPEGTSGQTPAEDDIDRQLRELTEGTASAARFREPSAAERAKAAKKQAKGRRKQAKARTRRDPGPSAGWRDGARHDLSVSQARKQAKRAARAHRQATRGRRIVRATSWTIAIVILAGAGVFGWHKFAHKMGSTMAGSAVRAINGQSVATGSVSPPAPTGPGSDPFVGTPADHWPNGAAGIVIPAAGPHGPFTAAQVAAAYATTRKLLIAANLDPTTLRGGTPAAFEDIETAQARQQFIAGLNRTGMDKYGESNSTRWLVTSFAPATTALIGNVIKVYGTMSAREATDHGTKVLDVDVNYHFVYPVERPHDPAAWMRIVLQVGGYVEFSDWQGSGGSLQPWAETQNFRAGAKCGMPGGFIYPDFPASSPDKVQPSGSPVDPYSPKIPSFTGCRTTTGT